MPSLYAAFTLLLLSLPHGFAAPVAQVSAAFEVSPLTGGALTLPEIPSKPRPGIGDGTLSVVKPTLTFPPIKPGYVGGSGSEAFVGVDPATPAVALPPSTPIYDFPWPTPDMDPPLLDPIPALEASGDIQATLAVALRPSSPSYNLLPTLGAFGDGPDIPAVGLPPPSPTYNFPQPTPAVDPPLLDPVPTLGAYGDDPDIPAVGLPPPSPAYNFPQPTPAVDPPLLDPIPTLGAYEDGPDIPAVGLPPPSPIYGLPRPTRIVKPPVRDPIPTLGLPPPSPIYGLPRPTRVVKPPVRDPIPTVGSIGNPWSPRPPKPPPAPRPVNDTIRLILKKINKLITDLLKSKLAQPSILPNPKLVCPTNTVATNVTNQTLFSTKVDSPSITKRQSQDSVNRVREFIKKWHTVGVAIANSNPRFLQGLMEVFVNPNIDPYVYNNFGNFPEKVRSFVLEYYVLAHILIDGGISTEDKNSLLKALFDTTGSFGLDLSGVTKQNMRYGLRRRQAEMSTFDEGAQLDDMEKLGGLRLTAITGPSGSLDPAGLSESDIQNFGSESHGAFSPFVKPSSGAATDYKNPYTRPNYKPTRNEYDGDYASDDDDLDTEDLDQYSRTSESADDYEGAGAGVPRKWVSGVPRPRRPLIEEPELSGCDSE